VQAANIKPVCLEVLPIPKDHIGLVIGRGGAIIKDIRERSGARVDARDQTEDPVQVLISGTRENVEAAKAMIFEATDAAGEARPVISAAAAHRARAKALAAAAAAALSNRVAQAEAEAKLNADGSAAASKQASTATPAASSTATASPAATAAAATAPAPPTVAATTAAATAAAAAASNPAVPTIGSIMELPKTVTGKVIGPRGSTIEDIRQKSGAKVEVDKSATAVCRIQITGSQDQVSLAKSLIEAVVGFDYSRGDPAESDKEYLEIPKASVGRIIGPQGSKLRELQTRSSCRIDIDRRDPERILVRFAGSTEAVAFAKTLVAEVLEGKDHAMEGEVQINLEIPITTAGRIIGPGGRQIQEIQERSKARVNVDKSTEPYIVRIAGLPEAVQAAEKIVKEIVATATRRHGDEVTTVRFDCDRETLDKLLHGEGGQWTYSVSRRSGARVQVKKDSAGTFYLELSGTRAQTAAAETICEDASRYGVVSAIAAAAEAVAVGRTATSPTLEAGRISVPPMPPPPPTTRVTVSKASMMSTPVLVPPPAKAPTMAAPMPDATSTALPKAASAASTATDAAAATTAAAAATTVTATTTPAAASEAAPAASPPPSPLVLSGPPKTTAEALLSQAPPPEDIMMPTVPQPLPLPMPADLGMASGPMSMSVPSASGMTMMGMGGGTHMGAMAPSPMASSPQQMFFVASPPTWSPMMPMQGMQTMQAMPMQAMPMQMMQPMFQPILQPMQPMLQPMQMPTATQFMPPVAPPTMPEMPPLP